MKKAISIFFGVQILIFITYFYSQKIFLNIEIAFLSAFLIILGSSFAYRKMIHSKIDSGEYEEDRDVLDTIDDPHELYDKVNDEVREGTLGYDTEINDAPIEELDLKQIVKEEKAKIKTLSLKNAKHGIRGSFAIMRLVPYIFLILGFIALKNNDVLDLVYYLPALLIGIVAGSLISREVFA
ncbi:hypothetical protein [Sulfurimonas autotrophica]|uniref:Uncharacterized protein n=1 Tax=Sulfurimonas autotrophica (strain ATCC BAA-671 / DSM 16294 / JCM 11897 / OK10) TaxID=563040 RepID=E0UT26_SULAO|nr:hypothetical protein [Sulfurimonas autotrophica]ADN09267.1 conserved hypothetical protein [Sulfurimonas autotrophica DSM 16294]